MRMFRGSAGARDLHRRRELGLRPRARIVASALSAVDPSLMGFGPIEAIRTALGRAGASIDDVDVFELNEAFAAQVIPVCRGMTGLRILSTLLTALEARDGTLAVESMCVGGGQGQAMVLERLS